MTLDPLQWGRIHADAEGCRIERLQREHHAASMGPHPCGCGGLIARYFGSLTPHVLQWGRIHADAEGLHLPQHPLVNQNASMGPHPCGCGGFSLPQNLGLSSTSFNGAASMRMRRGDLNQVLQGAAQLLQWGRIHADAEGTPAQRRGAASSRRFNGAASMRMRRAADAAKYCRPLGSVLQWGRIHADAEGKIRMICQWHF